MKGATLLAIAAALGAGALVACGAPSPAFVPPPGITHPLPPAGTVSLANPPPSRGGTMVVRFLDVGQGDAAIVTTDDRHAMLVDAGPPEAYERVRRALEAVGDAALDVMVLSHPHVDHMGRLGEVLAGGHFGYWLEPGVFPKHPGAYEHAARAATNAHVIRKTVRRGERFELGGHVEVTVLAPSEPLFSNTRDDVNANSVVLSVNHHASSGDVRVLFEADAEEPTEKRLLEHKDELRAEVLKVAHHGSQHASTDALLAAVSPRLAVISCGLGNDYGHPHARTLGRLERAAGAIARTDVQGDVTVTSDERGLSWTTDRPASPAELRSPGKSARAEPSP